VLGEHVNRVTWVGVAAATLGATLIAGKPDGAGSPLGVALSLGSLLIFLSWIVVMRRAPKVASDMAVPAVTVIVATVAILPIALLMHGAPKLDLSPITWTAIVAQGALSTLFATAAWQYGLARVGSASAGVFINIEPMMGAVLGVMLFGDHLTAALVIGGLMIMAGSFTVVLGEKSEATPAPV
jgi:drug/metabolite transporter (DMT)-like permease